MAQWLINPNRNHEHAGSIPGLDPWLKDLVLLWLWCRPAATAPIRHLAWETTHAAGAALERQKKKKNSSAETQAELKALKSRMNNAQEGISDLEGRIMELTLTGQ